MKQISLKVRKLSKLCAALLASQLLFSYSAAAELSAAQSQQVQARNAKVNDILQALNAQLNKTQKSKTYANLLAMRLHRLSNAQLTQALRVMTRARATVQALHQPAGRPQVCELEKQAWQPFDNYGFTVPPWRSRVNTEACPLGRLPEVGGHQLASLTGNGQRVMRAAAITSFCGSASIAHPHAGSC